MPICGLYRSITPVLVSFFETDKHVAQRDDQETLAQALRSALSKEVF